MVRVRLKEDDFRSMVSEAGSVMLVLRGWSLIFFLVAGGTVYYWLVDGRDLLGKPFPSRDEMLKAGLDLFQGVKVVEVDEVVW